MKFKLYLKNTINPNLFYYDCCTSPPHIASTISKVLSLMLIKVIIWNWRHVQWHYPYIPLANIRRWCAPKKLTQKTQQSIPITILFHSHLIQIELQDAIACFLYIVIRNKHFMTDPEGQDINNLIQWLHRVSLDRQWAANEEQKQWDECHWLASEETRLIQQLAAVQHEQQQTRDFAIGDWVVIKNQISHESGEYLTWPIGGVSSQVWPITESTFVEILATQCTTSGNTFAMRPQKMNASKPSKLTPLKHTALTFSSMRL